MEASVAELLGRMFGYAFVVAAIVWLWRYRTK